MEDKDTILILDDDDAITELIADSLTDEGFATRIFHRAADALSAVQQGDRFALMILDIMMPEMDGLEFCRRVRDLALCPIVFLTAKSSTLDVMLGLEMGADDYLKKPFVVEELVAKVKAHLRRERRAAKPAGAIKVGDILLRPDSYEVFKAGEPVALSTREFQLLELFMKNTGRVLSREKIFDEVWGSEYGDAGTVSVYIKNLREKLDPDSRYLKTVWGVGYRFVRPSEGE